MNEYDEFDYEDFAQSKIDSYNDFCKSVKILNHNTGEFFSLGDYDTYMSQRFYYVRDKFNLIHSLEIQNNNITPIFITTTVPSHFHDEHDVDGAYNALIFFRRQLYSNFKNSSNKFVKVSQINVIEPHKSMIPHQHSIYYVPTSEVNNFLKHYFKTLRFCKFNRKGQDFKILDSSPFAILYLLKYIEKTVKMEDKKIIGWYKKHKIRQFQTSTVKFFNKKIWQIMIKEKDYYFPNDTYNILEAYKKIVIKMIDENEKEAIEDSSHTIYCFKVEKKIKADKVQDELLPYFFAPKKTDTTSGREGIELDLFLMESCLDDEIIFLKYIDDYNYVSYKKYFCHKYIKYELIC